MPEEGGTKLTVYDSWQLNVAKDEYRARFLEHWNSTAERTSTGLPIDGLLLPPSAATAHPHEQGHRWIVYTSLFSMCYLREKKTEHEILICIVDLLDLPAMVIPVGSKVDPALDPVDANFQPANARDAKIQATCEA